MVNLFDAVRTLLYGQSGRTAQDLSYDDSLFEYLPIELSNSGQQSRGLRVAIVYLYLLQRSAGRCGIIMAFHRYSS